MQKQPGPPADARRAMQEASELPQPSIVDVDPEVPTQLLDDAEQYSIVDLEVEAQPSAEAEADIEGAAIIASADEPEEIDEEAIELDTPDETTADAYAAVAEDTGDLYGVHIPPAADPDMDKTEDQESFIDSEAGETWLETLEKKTAEYGAEPERQIDVVDDSDEHIEHRGHHATESGDPPVADKGSGGEGGL